MNKKDNSSQIDYAIKDGSVFQIVETNETKEVGYIYNEDEITNSFIEFVKDKLKKNKS